jgi:hypothetical protein
MSGFRRLALGSRERIAGSIYGTVVVLAVIADCADAYEEDLWKLEEIVIASVLILWLAHAYAHGVGESLRVGRRLARSELASIVGRELAIPLAAVLPLAAITIGVLHAIENSAAIWAAAGVGLATLGIQGLRFARLGNLSTIGTVVTVLINLSLALMIVGLKVLLSH